MSMKVIEHGSEGECSSSSSPTYVTYWALHGTRREREKERERGHHFPGRPWKSILYNSLLPSRQIKGPLLKKWGKGGG